MFQIPDDASFEAYKILLPVALILILAKVISLGFSKIHLPQVVGFLVAGLIVGCIYFIPGQTILSKQTQSGIDILAKFGVVLILFSAGVETDLKQIKAVGFASVVITSLGVIVPMGLGFLVAFLCRTQGHMTPSFLPEGVNPIYSDLYYGVILSATSVSITVATLKEIGKLESPVGSAIVAAAILDDIIGIVLLSLIISLSGSKASGSSFNLLGWFISDVCHAGTLSSGLNVVVILVNMALFFLLSWGASFLVRRFFNWLGAKYPHHIRIPIYSLAFCFLWAYMAQSLFQIADITGAYIAGLILSATTPKGYIDHRAETTANVFFVPIFFASVALKMFSVLSGQSAGSSFDTVFLIFGLLWIFVGLLGKIVGAGSGALMCKFKFKDAFRIGIGMMARAEVLIVTAQTGVDAKLVSPNIIPFTLGLILISSFLTPIILKLLYKGEPMELAHDTPSTNPPSPTEGTGK